VPHPRTMVTEVGTGLGMLGLDSLDEALRSRTPVMRSLSPENWDQLGLLRTGGTYDAEFHAAWENGRAFLAARDGLRDRRPEVIEWKGSVRAPGDEVAPIDLRIDHVYLVSCKYLSQILFNVSPGHVFDDILLGGSRRVGRVAGGDWFAEVAGARYEDLYDSVRRSVPAAAEALLAAGTRDRDRGPGRASGTERGSTSSSPHLPGLETAAAAVVFEGIGVGTAATVSALRQLPARASDLTSAQRAALSHFLKPGWPGDARAAYEELSAEVARASVERWRAALSVGGAAGAEAMLWRLLRMGSTPYFVLGSSARRSLRLRIATPWDWRQLFSLVTLEIFAQAGGQPRVGWAASVKERATGQVHPVSGHVEVRWSHGRFSGPPEAKGYLDTPHHLVPGYLALQ
jgi:hypothetical protein